MRSLPTGTVTFLFTDVEGSTRLVERLGPGYDRCLGESRRILEQAVTAARGDIVETEGDGTFAVFRTASDAVEAIVAAQRGHHATVWPDGATFQVRSGLHTGEGRAFGAGYVGIDVHRAARIAAAGHGGQVLVSAATRELVQHGLAVGLTLVDLGEHRLKDLDHPEHLYQLAIPGLRVDFPALRTLESRPNNLPPQLTSFVGRGSEVDGIRRVLGHARLVTLTGPGGTGKTRLALRVAGEVLPEFEDGIYFVALAPLRDPAHILPTAARAIGLQERPEESLSETLKRHLATRRTLLVLDNFEQLVEGAAAVAELLQSTPGLTLLVTSRAVLHLSGEHEFAVPPLDVPDLERLPDVDALLGFESVALFVQRAAMADPSFTLTEGTAEVVARICHRLEGLPLSIELAAARVRVFGLPGLLAQLDDRLAFLRGGPRDLPSRQQALRDTIAWSYELLPAPGQAVFRRLGPFLRGATVAAAAAVADPDRELGVDTLDALIGLADVSLVRTEPSPDNEVRFRMLETIREFARTQLVATGELETIAERHARFYLAFVEAAEPHVMGAERQTWLDRVERDHDNIRAALRWAVERPDPELGMRIGAALWRFWLQRNRLREGRAWLEQVLALPGAGDPSAHRLRSLIALGGLAYWASDYTAAGAAYREVLEVARALGDATGISHGEFNLAYIEIIEGDLDAAWSHLADARASLLAAGDETTFASAGIGLSLVGILREDWDSIRDIIADGVARFRRIHDRWGLANALMPLARVRRADGDPAGAEAAYGEALSIFREADDLTGMAMVLGGIAALRTTTGDVEAGLRIGGRAEALEEEVGGRAPVALRPYEDPRVVAEGRLDGATIARLWAEGRAMPLDHVLALATGDEPAG